MGDGEWTLVDSCLDADAAAPASITYLKSLGLSPAAVVRLVVITHWDDDHIRGVYQVVQECQAATIVCSAALRRKDIFAFVVAQEEVSGASGSGVDELRNVLRLAREESRRLLWAKATLPLHPTPPGDAPRAVALSPSEDAVERSIESLIEAATQQASTVPRRYRAPEGPNGASVAVSVRNADIALLLGADLIDAKNPETGWEAVVKYAKPPIAASVVKVPHHASRGAHCDSMWEELLEDMPVGIVTPWANGDKYLPLHDDLVRLEALTNGLYLTAMPALKRVKQDATVGKLLRKLYGNKEIEELRGWGQVRARRRLGEGQWRVELDGDAVELDGDAALT